MYDFLAEYDLIYESQKTRYHTRACQWYRERLLAESDDKSFAKDKPDFEVGRMIMEIYKKVLKSTEDTLT